MTMPGQFFQNDPVLKEVMRKHGLQWEDFVERDDESIYLPCARPDGPSIEMTTNGAVSSLGIYWYAGEKEVRYEVDNDPPIITVKNTQLPDATLTGLSGKKANAVIDLPGFDKITIECAVLSSSFVGNPLDLRMSIYDHDRRAA
tara:strand:+ start:10295 stop:10726 length:432 start_codon:yes stop_codon:yes gene_type:complete